MKGKRVEILIPCYNEGKTIAGIVKRSKRYGSVVVVDDGSSDSSSDLAKKAGAKVISILKNSGKADAVKRGVYELKGDIAILLDGDGQHRPEDIPRFLEMMENKGADIVIGSRFLGDPKKMPKRRKFSNKVVTSLLNLLSGYDLTDAQSGFRAIRTVKFKDMDYFGKRFDFEIKMIFEAKRRGMKVFEIPIETIYGGRKSHINPFKTALDVIRAFLDEII